MNSENWIYPLDFNSASEASYKILNQYSYRNFDWMQVVGSIYYTPYQDNIYCPEPMGGANIYCVLKRDGDNYEVVWSGLYNYERLDISWETPLVVVPSGEWGMGLIDTRDLSTYPSNSTDLALINDFRYTIVETTSGNAKELYYAKGVDLLGLNISDLTNVDWNGTTVEVSVISGVMGRVETSNHQLPYQYIFVSNEPVSGGPGYSHFWQSDPLSGMTSFIEYPDGLPSGLINIIRVDDRL